MRRPWQAVAGSLLGMALVACAPIRRGDAVEVVSLVRQIDQSQPDHDMCRSLTLTGADVITYFRLADEVDPETFHDQAMILPCSYTGSIRMSGQLRQWQIFAGGAAYLYDNNGLNRRYLCRRRCLDALSGLQ